MTTTTYLLEWVLQSWVWQLPQQVYQKRVWSHLESHPLFVRLVSHPNVNVASQMEWVCLRQSPHPLHDQYEGSLSNQFDWEFLLGWKHKVHTIPVSVESAIHTQNTILCYNYCIAEKPNE